jgi:transcriptional regulator with XRE-family HTH domain
MTGKDLQELRTGLRITVDALAEETGISRPYLSIMENREDGQATIPEKHVDAILAALERLGLDAEGDVLETRERIRSMKRERELAPAGGPSQ